MTEIAGHTFADTPIGRICVATRTTAGTTHICGRRWVDIRNVALTDVGTPGIAHVEPVNLRELNEIRAEASREDAAIAAATLTAAGFGIGGMAAGGEVEEL